MTETRIWLAQALCGSPERHCVVAAAGAAVDKDGAASDIATPLRTTILRLLKDGDINPWCGICGSPLASWRIEVGRTGFRTIEEAKPALAQLQAKNLAAQEMLGGHPGPGKTH